MQSEVGGGEVPLTGKKLQQKHRSKIICNSLKANWVEEFRFCLFSDSAESLQALDS